jgi:hypothetical protein
MAKKAPPHEPPSPYLGLEALVWRRLDRTTLHALYDQRHERGGGNKHIDLGRLVPLHEFLEIPKPSPNQRFSVKVRSADDSVVNMPVELNVRGVSLRTTWRLINQNERELRPAEWHPGGARLPADVNSVPDGFLLLFRNTKKQIHARVVFRNQLASELHDLAPLLQAALDNARQSSGMWPTPDESP